MNPTQFVFSTVKVLFWIVFIGLCIKTGAIIFTLIYSLIKPIVAENLYMGLNLSELLRFDTGYYVSMVTLIIALSGLKAYMAYLVIKLFFTIDLKQPFNPIAAKIITKISEVALGTGIVAILCHSYAKWLNKKPVGVENLSQYLDNGGEILFLAGVIFVIAQIFRKGVEIQSENELTV